MTWRGWEKTLRWTTAWIFLMAIFFTLESHAQTAMELFLNSGGTKLRGANMFQQEQYAEAGAVWNPIIVQQDLTNLRAKGANFVNFSVPGTFDVRTYAKRADFTTKLDQLINYAANADLYVVISFRTGPGRGEGRITGDGFNNGELFTNVTAQTAFVNMWKDVAQIYKDYSHVIAYDILVEPHDISVSTWTTLAQKIVDGIRTIDPVKPILVSAPDWGTYQGLMSFSPLTGSNLVYTVHQYEPYDYTHSNSPSDQVNALNEIYNQIGSWMSTHNKPVFINEFGLANNVSDKSAFMNAQIAKLESMSIGHAAWIWEVAYDPDYDYAEFDFKKDATLMSIYQTAWGQNSNFPAASGITIPTPAPGNLSPYMYPCGAPEGFQTSWFSSKLWVFRDCTSGQVSVYVGGPLFKKTHQALVSTSSGTLSLGTPYQLESGDITKANSTTVLEYSLSVSGSNMDGIRFSASESDARLCLTIKGPSKIKMRFGPDESEQTYYSGDKIDLKTSLPCP